MCVQYFLPCTNSDFCALVVPVIKKNSLVDVNSFLVMTPQVVNRGKAQLFKHRK